jgi:hypothetical protein
MVRRILVLISVVSATALTGCVTPGRGDVAGNFGLGVGYAISSAARDLFGRPASLPERAPQSKIRPFPPPVRPVAVFSHTEPVTPTKRHNAVPTPAKKAAFVATDKRDDSGPVAAHESEAKTVDCPLENVW